MNSSRITDIFENQSESISLLKESVEMAPPPGQQNSNQSNPPPSLFRIYRDAPNSWINLCLYFAILLGLASGTGPVVFNFTMGRTNQTFNSYTSDSTDYKNKMLWCLIDFIIIFVVYFVINFASYLVWNYHGTHLSIHLKKKYFSLILKQDQSWFDAQNVHGITTRIENAFQSIDQAVSKNYIIH